ncbi:coatomer subunit beta [Tieghemiomyces parasiticus]|uniref:Coatomer subunit beta n=1 Tax=Tieghemiomyces parasiticus TaxID=78921 RepID=A0A9W8A716_9FUNG|nr:coatomer subunit beta [Tieghemiomyces parasiticus]
MASNQCYVLVAPDDNRETPSVAELKKDLERSNDHIKIDAMRKLLVLMVNGQPCPELLMHVIRFVMPSKNKVLKKLLHFYWEICSKTDADGKLRQEMILVCNAIRNDLQHPNEYIRGATLRFLCKIHEPEILEPLLPTVRACLEHRHSYVRKNAVFAVHAIYKHSPALVPDAAELIGNFLLTEADMACRRNAFVSLSAVAPELAAQYIKDNLGRVLEFEELLQLAVIDFVRKDGRAHPADRSKFIRCVFELLDAPAHAVKYEAATTLVNLTSNPAAVKAAAACFIELAVKESDNNVKLIVLDRLGELHRDNGSGVLSDLVMDVLRVLSSPDLEVRRRALKIAMELTTQRNIQDVVIFLKKELARTTDQGYDQTADYRHLLIRTIHNCAIRFSEAATEVVHALMDSINDFNTSSAVDVINFVREVVEKFPALRAGILARLLEALLEFKSGQVLRGALWILGEYSLDLVTIEDTWAKLREATGEIPILAAEQRRAEEANPNETTSDATAAPLPSSSRRILPDGTYASESSLGGSATALEPRAGAAGGQRPCIRTLLLKGDFFLGTALANTLVKLVIRLREVVGAEPALLNARRAEAMLIMTGMVRLGQSDFVANPIDEDSRDRILACLRALDNTTLNDPLSTAAFLEECKASFTRLLVADDAAHASHHDASAPDTVQPDELITFGQLAKKTDLGVTDTYEVDVLRATGDTLRADSGSKLDTIVQLAGFSDPVYAEAYVNINQYDIVLDVLIVNQTAETLRNLTVEFTTLGDLKLVEKPTEHNLAPHGFYTLQAHIKVSSTETGVIFGTVYYDGPGAAESTCVVLNDVHIDIMEYIRPATCDESQFREMWTEFEWENKVLVNTPVTDLRAYLDHVLKITNMSCLTPANALSGDCGFISANLYARSIFGEDALANLSIEQHEHGAITGHIRIRSKTQGIALNLGDKISLGQKASATQ